MTSNILITIKKELTSIIRDKKSLLMMLVTPLMIPLMVVFCSFIYNNMLYNDELTTYTVGTNYKLNSIEKEIVKEYNIKIKYYNDEDKLKKAFNKGEISSYVLLDNNKYTIYLNELNEDSQTSGSYISAYLENYNTYLAQYYLTTIGADIDKVYNNINYEFEYISNGSNDLVTVIITLAFIFAIMSITLTAVYSATDSTAGEKERGTLETLLTFPIKSNELITGKYLAITISCIITSIISIVLAIGSLAICSEMFDIYNDVIFNFNFLTVTLSLIIMISYSLFISGLCIAIASFSKTYKEAQSALTPLSMLVMVPMFLNVLGIDMNPVLSLIPIVNHTLLINDIFCDNINILNISIMFISTIVYVIIIIKFITHLYKSEKILFSI
jgi:sodium transport system permease protein